MDNREVIKNYLTDFFIDYKNKITKDQFLFIVKAFILTQNIKKRYLFEIFFTYDIDKIELKNYILSLKDVKTTELERLYLIKLVFNLMAEIELGKNSDEYKEKIKYFDLRIKNEQFRLKKRKK